MNTNKKRFIIEQIVTITNLMILALCGCYLDLHLFLVSIVVLSAIQLCFILYVIKNKWIKQKDYTSKRLNFLITFLSVMCISFRDFKFVSLGIIIFLFALFVRNSYTNYKKIY